MPNTSPFLQGLYGFRLFGLKLLQLPVLLFALCLIGFGLLLHRTRFGNGIYVAGGNAEAGYSSGIEIGKTKPSASLLAVFVPELPVCCCHPMSMPVRSAMATD